MRVAHSPLQGARGLTGFDHFRRRGGPGRLEAEQHADGFENRGFTLGILANDAGPARLWMKIQRLEAAEAAQANLGDHAGDSAR